MLTLNDGRSELWQWDTKRKLTVEAECSQVHFSNKVFGRSIDVDVTDGVAIIPDILLQTDKDLNVWAFVGTAENGYTKISKTFKVNRRNKPADYVFTPEEQMTLNIIQRQIGDLSDLTTEAKDTLVAAINEALTKGGGVDPEEVWRIVNDYLAANPPSVTETDPTVPAWAKAAEKPAYTAAEVGADLSGTAEAKVAAHNTRPDTHRDIRLLISGLTDRLNALADSDDTTLDQLSEVVAYIKSNRTLIEAITTDKVSVSDVIDNLTSNVSNKPLSAAQGVALKGLIDAISIPDKLPNPNALTFTGAATGTYDGSAPLSVEIPYGGGSGGSVSANIEKVYSWTADGTVQTNLDSLAIEPNKIYFCELIVPNDGSMSAGSVDTPNVYVRIGTTGNTYTGSVVGSVKGQNKFIQLSSKYTFFVDSGIIHIILDRTQSTQNVPVLRNYTEDQVYIYSATPDTAILAGTTVNIYKMG